MRRIFLMFLVSVVVTVGALGQQVQVEDVDGASYVATMHRELGAATGSVVVSMFQMRVPEDSFQDSPALLLVSDLIAAQRRGVDVKVVLDLHSEYDPQSSEPVRDHLNGVAADMLAYAGVDVSYYPSRYHLHHKLVVIDEKVVVIGSHNWSYSAMRHNIESSSIIRSREHARAKLESIARIETIPVVPVSTAGERGTVPVPRAFLLRPNLAPIMHKENDERPFDSYLLLRRYAATNGGKHFSVDLQQLAADLGIDPAKGAANSRRLAIRPLRRLAEHYGLIDLNIPRGKDAEVTLLDDVLGGAFIRVPVGYWAYGLATELKQAEKLAYLICLNEETQGLTPPFWRKSQVELARIYSATISPINEALNGLQRRDLLTINRSPITADYKKRRPNQYGLKPLLSPAERATRWRKLEKKHTPEGIAQARALASTIGYGNDFDSADELAAAIRTYGYEAVKKTTEAVATKQAANPKRNAGTITTYLRNARRMD
jgi:hypothetical protein